MSLNADWRDNGGGRSIAAQANEMALMTVIPQRAVTLHDFRSGTLSPFRLSSCRQQARTNPVLPCTHAQHCCGGRAAVNVTRTSACRRRVFYVFRHRLQPLNQP